MDVTWFRTPCSFWWLSQSVSLHGCSSLWIFLDLHLHSPSIFEPCWWSINLMNQGWKGSFPMGFCLMISYHRAPCPRDNRCPFERNEATYWKWRDFEVENHQFSGSRLFQSAMLMAQKSFLGSSNHVAIEDFRPLKECDSRLLQHTGIKKNPQWN